MSQKKKKPLVGIGRMLPSIHRHKGWKRQYQRMMRWLDRFKDTNPGDFESADIDEQHDLLYACFQNIFYLKDWLKSDAKVQDKVLNEFINNNIELQLCRDICNGTKHFNITDASVENDFTIIREYMPFNKILGGDKYKIVILSGGNKYELKELAWKCITLWDSFIQTNKIS